MADCLCGPGSRAPDRSQPLRLSGSLLSVHGTKEQEPHIHLHGTGDTRPLILHSRVHTVFPSPGM